MNLKKKKKKTQNCTSNALASLFSLVIFFSSYSIQLVATIFRLRFLPYLRWVNIAGAETFMWLSENYMLLLLLLIPTMG